MNVIYANNVPQAYTEAIIKLRIWGEEEESRNGPVITSQDPVLLQIQRPTERVLFDKVRNANPFFHVMEFVWMMSGSNNVKWIEQFNKKFRDYADVGTDVIHGAYGHRWLHHFDRNQIQVVGDTLRNDPTSRRCVMGMWDPRVDLSPHNDLPCNTQIMFRAISQGSKSRHALDMTVINRSNDLIWGMLGANAVHMTYLHELVAWIAGMSVGLYSVFTNNLHIYKNMPNFDDIWATRVPEDDYRRLDIKPYPLLSRNETYADLVNDCINLIDVDIENEPAFTPQTFWVRNVAWPMRKAYYERLLGNSGKEWISDIQATDWRLSCENYVNLREERK